MVDEALLTDLRKIGIDIQALVAPWKDSVELLAAMDAIARAGSNAVVKIDGGRAEADVYTVVVSGGRLGEEFFRKDGADLRMLLREAVSFFAERVGGERNSE
jgi:hypothetical protein